MSRIDKSIGAQLKFKTTQKTRVVKTLSPWQQIQSFLKDNQDRVFFRPGSKTDHGLLCAFRPSTQTEIAKAELDRDAKEWVSV